MSAELIALAERFSDATTDKRGRRAFSFDSYGLADFAAAISAQARASEAEDAMPINVRAAFEHWLARQESFEPEYLYRRNFQGSARIGEYCHSSVEFGWMAWQASRSTGDAGRGETK